MLIREVSRLLSWNIRSKVSCCYFFLIPISAYQFNRICCVVYRDPIGTLRDVNLDAGGGGGGIIG